MKIIIGLGNPGKEYAHNRHNVGFLCLNYIARKHEIKLDKKEGKAVSGSGIIGEIPVVLAKPRNYMNLSGQSVSYLCNKYKLTPEDLVVVHDDLDLPLGIIRIRMGSGAGGHRGIKSIISFLGTKDFMRIRVGIGRPQSSDNKEEVIINYVLGDFTPYDKPVLQDSIHRVNDAVLCILNQSLSAAMNKYNTKNPDNDATTA